MPKPTKHDPLEAAKITTERAQADEAALGVTMPVDPTRPPLVGEVPPGQFVPPPESGEPATPLLEGGPTIEEWIASGYPAEKYPPSGYAEKPSSGLTLYKAGSPIPEDWIDAARAKKTAAPSTKKVVFVVTADGRGNCGHGQVNFFRKGDVLELAGYGERGIQRLIDSGLKLEREER